MRLVLTASIVLVALWTIFIIFLISLVLIWADQYWLRIYVGCLAGGFLAGCILNKKAVPAPYLLSGGGLLTFISLVGSIFLFVGFVIFSAGLGTVMRQVQGMFVGQRTPSI